MATNTGRIRTQLHGSHQSPEADKKRRGCTTCSPRCVLFSTTNGAPKPRWPYGCQLKRQREFSLSFFIASVEPMFLARFADSRSRSLGDFDGVTTPHGWFLSVIEIPFRCSFQKCGIRWGLFEIVVSLLLLEIDVRKHTPGPWFPVVNHHYWEVRTANEQ